MGLLKERLESTGRPAGPIPDAPARKPAMGGVNGRTTSVEDYQVLKTRIHRNLINRLDLTRLDKLHPNVLREEITRIVEDMLTAEVIPLSVAERERVITEVRDELFGLGPLEPLLHDRSISDILVNTFNRVYVERRGKLELTDVLFKDNDHLRQIIDRIVSSVGRRIDESSPMVDARLLDGSRVNAIIPPLALDGPILSIRRFGTISISMDSLVQMGSVSPGIAFLLEGCVKARLNILISGGTGAGKTTLLNILSSFIPSDERIVTIEDSAELRLMQEHVVRLETRPPNIEGKGQITQRDLVRNALRMRPDRIVLGEVRSDEAMDMLQAMNTGHDGSLATIHANTPRDCMTRLETLVSMAGLQISDKAMRHQIASAINVVVQASRLTDGSRKITSLAEVTGMEGDVIAMQEIFTFDRQGVDKDGKVLGQIKPTGIRPRFTDRLKRYGYQLSSSIFDEGSR
ncbi:MAG: CpaF family protein [Acidobacteria bacterium]|nr:CpaF family protein [Acidobacteriota bacterium]